MLEEKNSSNYIPPITVFKSEFIDKEIENNIKKIRSQKIAQIYSSCLKDTLETKLFYSSTEGDVLIYSYKLPAIWITQTCMQIYPYIKYCNKDKNLPKLILGVFNKLLKCLLIDPFANAFTIDNSISSPWVNDITFKKTKDNKFSFAMCNEIWERKFELSSMIFPFYMMYKYYEETKDNSFITENFFKALIEVIKVIKTEQRDTDEENFYDGPQYFFQRKTNEQFETLHYGRGSPSKN